MDYSLAKDLFGSWNAVLHRLIVGTLSYFGLIVWLRVSGKRTLSKWNAFDFVVTIAFGSILASALLTGSTSLVQAMLSIGLLVGLQYLLTWLSARAIDQLHHVCFDRQQQLAVDVDVTKFVYQYRYLQLLAIGQNMVQQRGLAAAQKPGD